MKAFFGSEEVEPVLSRCEDGTVDNCEPTVGVRGALFSLRCDSARRLATMK